MKFPPALLLVVLWAQFGGVSFGAVEGARVQIVASPHSPAKPTLAQRLARLSDPLDPFVFVVAHRGDWRHAPENSLLAIREAITMGVDVVEIDVCRTRDGVLVLMHDTTVDRTTDGTGRVDELDAATVLALHLKNGLGRVTLHTVPTLTAALQEAHGQVLLNIDKGGDYLDEVFALTEATGTTAQVIVKSSMPVAEVRARFGDRLDRMVYMPVIDLDAPDALTRIDDYQRELSLVAYELIFARTDAAKLSEVRRRLAGRSRIWINALWPSLNGGHDDDRALDDPVGAYGWLLDQGATMIQSDRCRRLLDYLQTRDRRGREGNL